MVYEKKPRRCKFEEDRRGACRKGSNCDFLHPGDPGWDRAPEGFGRASRSFSGPSRARDGFGAPKSSEWDKSTWGPSASNTTKLPEGTSKWGGFSQPEASSSKANESAKSAWDSSTKPGVNQGGPGAATWGASSSTDGWSTSAPTWGTGTIGGWGSLLGNEDENKTKGKESGGDTWGAGGSISTLGENTRETSRWGPADNAPKSEGKGKQREDIDMRDPFPPSDAWSSRPPDGSSARPTSLSPDKPFHKPVLPNARAPSQELAPSQTKPAAFSSTLQPGFILESDLVKEVGELAKTRAEGGGKAPNDTKSSPLTGSTPTNRYIGPNGRVALFTAIVRYMQDVIVCQAFLLRAQAEEDRWKRTQGSQAYERASFRTRQMLESHRTTYADKVKNAKRQLHKALERLAALPDFATQIRTIGPGLTKEALTTYTTEFKEWVQDLELHKRVLLEKAAASPKRLTAQELLDREHWTFRELKEAIAQLEERLNNTAEEIYAEVYTKFEDFTLEDDHSPIPPDEAPRDFGPQMDDLEIDANDVSNHVLQQGRRMVELKEKVRRLETEIALVVDEKARMDQLAGEAELQHSEFQQLRAAEDQEIRELTQKMQTLHLHKPVPSTLHSTLEPAQIDSLLDHIKPVVISQLESDLAPIFATLRQRCLDNQNNISGEIDEMVKPIIAMTDEIYQRATPPSPKTGPNSQ
ncbi:hypothetical protein M413DRAFT_439168 [Hebeloma cylindrosporum]|uniref:C3H1-type domain-containing protein n=1 Tax=Hebeloma cylindrosporum TaxID=76867 RepID=A0A0C2Z2L2_HEBCY|nr:hypothetical protein M413DRAFT_439168 [Hebeloma cylindrosporum h7]